MFRPRCAFCSHTNPPASKYCTACGARLHVVHCSSCNALNDASARACQQCGVPLPDKDIALEAHALTTAQTTVDTSAPAIAGGDVYDQARPTLSQPSLASLPSDSADSGAANDTGNRWAGSASVALTGSAPGRIATPSSLAERGRPIAIIFAVVILAGIAFYAYRNSVNDAPQSAWVGVVNRGDGRSGGANDSSRSAGGTQDDTGEGRDPVAGCTEAVAALGLCLPQSSQRKD
ncbi:MAG: zinc ribbon domain-containing protein [Burkholderiales bacterium]